MKKWLTKKSNLLTLFVVALVVWRQFPLLKKNFEAEGIKIESRIYPVIYSPLDIKQVEFPPQGNRTVAIFWATWCRPCKLEMERLQNSVENTKMMKGKIIAVNPFESELVIKKFLRTNSFDFTFIYAPDLNSTLDVEVTPTTVFIDKNEISSMSTGMSITGILKVERFLKQ